MDGASIAQRVFDRCRSGIVCRHHRLGFRSGTRADRRWRKSFKGSGSGLMSSRVLFPDGWAPPIGYANGIETTPGKMVFVAGQVGWDANQKFKSEELVPQFEQALRNVLQVLAVAGGRPDHILFGWSAGTRPNLAQPNGPSLSGNDLGVCRRSFGSSRQDRARSDSHYSRWRLMNAVTDQRLCANP